MQSPEIFIAQNPQHCSKRFRKNLTTTVISGIGGNQCKLSLKIYEEKLGKEKNCWKGSH